MESVVVVGFIPTAEGEAALKHGIVQARSHGAKLVAVNVASAGVYMDDRVAQPEDRADVRAKLEGSGVPFEMVRPEYGVDASDFLLEVCRERQPLMVVIGLRHRSAVGKLLLGSVAQRILMQADCPVLAVRA